MEKQLNYTHLAQKYSNCPFLQNSFNSTYLARFWANYRQISDFRPDQPWALIARFSSYYSMLAPQFEAIYARYSSIYCFSKGSWIGLNLEQWVIFDNLNLLEPQLYGP